MKLHKYKEESISILKQLQESGNITESLIDTKSLQNNIIQFKKQNTNKAAAPSSLSKYPFEDVKSPNFDQVQKQIKNSSKQQMTRPPSREEEEEDDSLQAKEVATSQMRVNRKGSKTSKHNNQQDSEEGSGSGSILASGIGVAVGKSQGSGNIHEEY